MNVANTVTKPQSLAVAVPGKSEMQNDGKLTIINAPQQILQSALEALSEGRLSEVVEHFDDCFRFHDHALTVEFTDKLRLTEFLEKSRELFPDTTLEVVSLFEDGNHAIAEWKLRATQTIPYGSISYRLPISLPGTTIVHVENGRIGQWSDYYDQSSSRRMNLGAFFTEWIEY
jgi:hypothetical protein